MHHEWDPCPCWARGGDKDCCGERFTPAFDLRYDLIETRKARTAANIIIDCTASDDEVIDCTMSSDDENIWKTPIQKKKKKLY